MNPIQFDRLPYLCGKKIFEFLSLRDLANCRAVNRQFKFFAEQAAVDELKVTDYGTPCEDEFGLACGNWAPVCWLPDLIDRPIDFENLIGRTAFASVNSSPFKLDQLKALHVHCCADLDVGVLNGFKKLVHLELILLPTEKINTLMLPNLKILILRDDFYHIVRPHPPYVLKTPKLEVLTGGQIDRIRVEHPETIKRLECEYRGNNDLAQFKNLEVLNCRNICGALNLLLSDWEHLKELNLETILEFGNGHSEFLSSLTDIMRQRAALKREQLKLYLEDVLLEDATQLVNHRGMHRVFQLKNYGLLRRDCYGHLEPMNFNDLIGTELSTAFFDRFPAIERLSATRPVDRDDFEWFLKNASAVRELSLANTSLDQTFMNRLPKINSRLTYLEVKKSSDLIINFDFILQFEQLKRFVTDRQLDSLDLPAKAFQQLKEFESFHFRADDRVEIHRSEGGFSFCEFYQVMEPVDAEDFLFEEDEEDGEFFMAVDKLFCRENLKWEKLVALFDQRDQRAAKRKMAARIKRARLE